MRKGVHGAVRLTALSCSTIKVRQPIVLVVGLVYYEDTDRYEAERVIQSDNDREVDPCNRQVIVNCRALLFDLDGVLIDSTPAVARVWTRWALERGFNPQEVVARAHGRPSLTTVREYLPNANHASENQKVEQAEIDDLEGVIPLPGTLELLQSLPDNRWTIVTSCTRALAEVRIRAAGLPLPANMITSTDIVNGKPYPEPYLKGAAILGFDPAQCVVVEDAPAGIRAGKAAGSRVIAFATTSPASALRSAGADWILNNCADIILVERTSKSSSEDIGLSLSVRQRT
ncbi:MAG TPA: HAD family hydrolase [Candidatus Sulfotelmatobacter sp.]